MIKTLPNPLIQEEEIKLRDPRYWLEKVGIDKDVVYSEETVMDNLELFKKYMDYFLVYPDKLVDLLVPLEHGFKLSIAQRIQLRAIMRYKTIYITATRGAAKTYTSVLGLMIKAILLPGSQLFLCAPTKEQGAKIFREVVPSILKDVPLVDKEIKSKTGMGPSSNRVVITFKNGSMIEVATAIDSSRGVRRHGGITDEVRDHDGEQLQQIIEPTMTSPRATALGIVNPLEPQPTQIYITSAGQKGSFAYEKLVSTLSASIADPSEAFVWGYSYKVPVKEGIVSKGFMDMIRRDRSTKPQIFAQEYMSIWGGASDKSWFSEEMLHQHRKIINAETQARRSNFVAPENQFYVIAVDVARDGNADTVFTVIKVLKGETYFTKKVVFITKVLSHERHFTDQANKLKKLILAFDPVEVVIDNKGLGKGLTDAMTEATIDSETGITYQAYRVIDDPERSKKAPKNAPEIIRIVTPNPTFNDEVFSNCYLQISSGRVKFLIREADVMLRLNNMKKTRRMDVTDKMMKLMPYQMTTNLFEEMMNLQMRTSGQNNNLSLELINTKRQKDRFSSLCYGLYSIKLIEDEYYHRKNRGIGNDLVNFAGLVG